MALAEKLMPKFKKKTFWGLEIKIYVLVTYIIFVMFLRHY